jgi:hypothetical protein
MPHRNNFLLNRLPPELLVRLGPHLVLADLNVADVLAETHQRIEKVYFPHTGIISCVVELKGGGAIETGMIGNDGNFGASQASLTSSGSITSSSRLPAKRRLHASGFALADELPVFRGQLIKMRSILSFPSPADGRLQRSIRRRRAPANGCMRMHEFAAPDLVLTQEFLAQRWACAGPASRVSPAICRKPA